MSRQQIEEPLRGFIHGPPGTGKSRLIHWICRFFKEALGWEHKGQFICIAYQNRVAHAMGGVTVHSGGDVGVGEYDKKLEHTDIDLLFTRNQDLRWIICDEVGMVGEDLLHAFEKHITDAAKISTYKQRADKSLRPFGGYNILTFGDLFQIPPIPASSSICIPPESSETLQQSSALALFWSVDSNESINFLLNWKSKKELSTSLGIRLS